MKNRITGGLAAAVFAAPFILFAFQVSSCGNGGGNQASTTLGSATKNTTTSGAKATLTCQGKNCGSVIMAGSSDTSPGVGPKRYYFVGTTDSAIAARTQIRIEVELMDSATY